MTPIGRNNLIKTPTAPQSAPPPRTLLWRGMWTVAVFHVAFAVFVLLNLHAPRALQVGDDFFETAGGLLAMVLCFVGAKGRSASAKQMAATPREVWVRRLFAATLICYTLGQATYAYTDLVLRATISSFSPCDIWYMASYLLLLGGIVLLPARPLPVSARPRMALDALMSMAALVTFSWYFLLGPILVQKHVSLSTKFVAASYPTLDLLAIFCMLMLGQHSMPPALRRITTAIAWGLAATTASDSMTGYQSLHGQPIGGTFLDLGWSLGYGAIALAVSALRLYSAACRHAQDEPPRLAVLWQSLLPYAFLPAVGLLIACLSRADADTGLATGVYVGASVLVVLVLLRQIAAIFENRDLTARLATTYQEAVRDAQKMQQLNFDLTAMQSRLHNNLQALTLANERLERLADTDAVSGLLNHRGMAAALEEARTQFLNTRAPCALLFLDIDHFKALNDAHGHPAGDCALREVADEMRARLGPDATLGRWGGEEFLALLTGASFEAALAAAEAVRAGIAARPLSVPSGLRITCSTGVAALPLHAAEWPALVDAADRAMYATKHAGHNRVCIAADLSLAHAA